MFSFSRENKINSTIVGVDEVGRGPLAGPVFAAAVILSKNICLKGINDSKKLSKKKMSEIFNKIISFSKFSIGLATVEEIDKINILQASLLAMKRAVKKINIKDAIILVDGTFSFDKENKNIKTFANGDSIYPSIAAASIIAKVIRDKHMYLLSKQFPEYGWDKNSGYGTSQHMISLAKYGPTPLHRKTFAPIHKMLFKK